MKIAKWDGFLPVSAALGGLGLVLRLLQRGAVDDRGLLVPGHPATTLLWLLVPVTLGLTLALLRGHSGRVDRTPSGLGAAGCLAGAAGCLVSVFTAAVDGWLVWRCFGVAAGVGLVLLARGRWLGKQVSGLASLAVCLFFLAHLVMNYRVWSADPQTMDYLFDLLATIFLMIFCYDAAALGAGLGKPLHLTGAGLLSVSFCLMALANSQWPWLYLGGLALALTNRLPLVPKEDRHGSA